MSDEPETERLRYTGGTTRHDGPGDKPQTLSAVSSDELGIDDIQPGVGNAALNKSPEKEPEAPDPTGEGSPAS